MTGNASLRVLRGAVYDAESFSAIIDGKLYLGNLLAAESPQLMMRLGITHILSVCPDYLVTSKDVKHLTIPVQDDEHFNILQHLPATCQFIQEGLDEGGKVFVHCAMGISRSAIVVSAYLMFSHHISAAQAIQAVRAGHPQSRPNYNFVRQLQVFSECNYDPSDEAAPYIAWRARQEFDETHSLRVIDAMPVIEDRLFLSFDFPSDSDHATALLDHLGITHIVSITPDALSDIRNLNYVHKHFIVPYTSKESLLLSLPPLCKFIEGAMQEDGSRVFLHCLDEMRAGIAICAYLMFSRRIQPSEALEILQDRVPLFDDNPLVRRHLELFQECQYTPSHRHPLVRAWLSTPLNPPLQINSASHLGENT
ncbi:protein-tyrosine phosphatase-like protein [Mycena galericulata]|nr:protein-tyrosine phosphatase-like protein [Mycena galericulata]